MWDDLLRIWKEVGNIASFRRDQGIPQEDHGIVSWPRFISSTSYV